VRSGPWIRRRLWRRTGCIELGRGDVGRQPAALQLTAGDDERVLLEQFVERSRIPKIALTGAPPLFSPTWSRSPQGRGVTPKALQAQLGRFDVTSEGDPGQRLACLLQDVVRQRPIAFPRLSRQRLALARQVLEVAALLRLADLLFDGAFPVRQLFRGAALLAARQIFLVNQLASAWIASASTSISRLSCCSVLIRGGASTIVLLIRRGRTPLSIQRPTIRPVNATALS